MKRYRIYFFLIAALTMTSLTMTSCLDEHPKDQLDEEAIYGSASDIYTNAVASLYNYIGGTNESEGLQGTCRGIYDYNTLTTAAPPSGQKTAREPRDTTTSSRL